MRPEFALPPESEASLGSIPVHVLVREFPEALPLLREKGVDLREKGGGPLRAAGPEVVVALAGALEWRRGV